VLLSCVILQIFLTAALMIFSFALQEHTIAKKGQIDDYKIINGCSDKYMHVHPKVEDQVASARVVAE